MPVSGVLLQLRSWLLPIGWSLSLCTISVKMWRVFVIYRTTKRLKSLKEKRVNFSTLVLTTR